MSFIVSSIAVLAILILLAIVLRFRAQLAQLQKEYEQVVKVAWAKNEDLANTRRELEALKLERKLQQAFPLSAVERAAQQARQSSTTLPPPAVMAEIAQAAEVLRQREPLPDLPEGVITAAQLPPVVHVPESENPQS